MASIQDITKYDDVFLGILQNCGKIEPFLDAIFNFLSRRTDFFRLMHKKDDKLGFPPGYAEKMLIKIFEKHQERVLKNDPIYMKWKKNQKNKEKDSSNEISDSNQITVDENNTVPTNDVDVDDTSSHSAENIPVSSTVDIQTSEETISSENNESSELDSTSKNKSSVNSVDNDCFNGGKTDKYSWSQSLTDVDIKVPIPPFIKASKELSIEIKSYSLNVSLKKDPPRDSGLQSRVLVAGTLREKIRCDESLWSLMPGDHVAVNLEKFEQKWWDGIFEGDEKIDKSSIDTTQQVHDFDEQTQGDIRKVMYDQQQRMMGQPTSDEQKTHKMLEKAWDAEGSPFRGTPFDPSRVNLANGGL